MGESSDENADEVAHSQRLHQGMDRDQSEGIFTRDKVDPALKSNASEKTAVVEDAHRRNAWLSSSVPVNGVRQPCSRFANANIISCTLASCCSLRTLALRNLM